MNDRPLVPQRQSVSGRQIQNGEGSQGESHDGEIIACGRGHRHLEDGGKAGNRAGGPIDAGARAGNHAASSARVRTRASGPVASGETSGSGKTAQGRAGQIASRKNRTDV